MVVVMTPTVMCMTMSAMLVAMVTVLMLLVFPGMLLVFPAMAVTTVVFTMLAFPTVTFTAMMFAISTVTMATTIFIARRQKLFVFRITIPLHFMNIVTAVTVATVMTFRRCRGGAHQKCQYETADQNLFHHLSPDLSRSSESALA